MTSFACSRCGFRSIVPPGSLIRVPSTGGRRDEDTYWWICLHCASFVCGRQVRPAMRRRRLMRRARSTAVSLSSAARHGSDVVTGAPRIGLCPSADPVLWTLSICAAWPRGLM